MEFITFLLLCVCVVFLWVSSFERNIAVAKHNKWERKGWFILLLLLLHESRPLLYAHSVSVELFGRERERETHLAATQCIFFVRHFAFIVYVRDGAKSPFQTKELTAKDCENKNMSKKRCKKIYWKKASYTHAWPVHINCDINENKKNDCAFVPHTRFENCVFVHKTKSRKSTQYPRTSNLHTKSYT